jgi:hypothetical protein
MRFRLRVKLCRSNVRARRASVPLRIVVSCLLIYASAACGAEDDFGKLYDYYFPKEGKYVNSDYRRWFDKTLSGPPPTRQTERHPEFYFAFHGDSGAFHKFVNDPDRDAEGEFAETWMYECVVLLLKLGDEKFAELLAKEDSPTREAVGVAIDSQINWSKHQFPKTRALYSYRYVPPTQREREQREREPVAVAWKGVTPDQWKRIGEVLEKEKRFSDVQLTSTDEGITSITIPRSMSKRDKDDLRRLIRRELKDTKGVEYYP